MRVTAASGPVEPAPANDDAVLGDLPGLMLEGSARAVFINGRLAPALSDLEGVTAYVLPLADALGADWVQALLGRQVDEGLDLVRVCDRYQHAVSTRSTGCDLHGNARPPSRHMCLCWLRSLPDHKHDDTQTNR